MAYAKRYRTAVRAGVPAVLACTLLECAVPGCVDFVRVASTELLSSHSLQLAWGTQ
jgi:hypothetical protein